MTITRHHEPLARPPLDFDEYRRAAFSLAVQRRREERGLSRGSVAELAGLTVLDVIDIEEGAEVPTIDVLFSLADALRTDAAELLHETRALAEDLLVERWIDRRRGLRLRLRGPR